MTTTTNPQTLINRYGIEVFVPLVRDIDEAEFLQTAFSAVLTVGPSEREVQWDHPNHLVQTFGDYHIANGRGPKRHHVERIIEFGLANDGPILVHCHQGMSRSTSSAITIMVARGVDPELAVSTLAGNHPKGRPFIPNPVVVGLAAELLNEPDLLEISNSYFDRGNYSW